ncbi:hypothetical protein CC1G_10752 [Coprinopsis cinerea okayama7|uniref:Uncharacterized protein n=1 Tax=Coprinopsis cinerea (strain Okayama-7 / 130 / ATCC MYA-4618 / FGSC 9003) TaxID=240176 RepID=A8P3B0_COPC7|nr:hypothetical protein CC1G_10752 [Coprinopsis cinerea okayama7\|eukprot:XP_001838510.2 hypothetical protein CC1G_10752 [Coprinopsis cinerea okayama7\
MTQIVSTSPTTAGSVDILILGAGWTSSFLIPLCMDRSLLYAATTRDGRDGTLKFVFDPESADLEPYRVLPDARTVLITFPITVAGGSVNLVKSYIQSRDDASRDQVAREAQFIQLGTSSVWDGGRRAKGASAPPKPVENKWYDRHSPIVLTDRAKEEEELLGLASEYGITVLNLVGLWGGSRSPKNWVGKVAPTKDALKAKGNIHLIHGVDVARSILAVHSNFAKARGQRWVVSDGRVYDWWSLASVWGGTPGDPSDKKEEDGDRGPYARWVRELMEEAGVRALPRNIEVLGRAIDSQEFWRTFELTPTKTLLGDGC